jgi:hypothetical protein
MKDRLSQRSIETLRSAAFLNWLQGTNDVLISGLTSHIPTLVEVFIDEADNGKSLALHALTSLLAKYDVEAVSDFSHYVEREYGMYRCTLTRGVFRVIDRDGDLVEKLSPFWSNR